MIRVIEGFHQDGEGDWVAELSCLHAQHVRHRPPWQERPWVETTEGRDERIGAPIECVPCDRTELPDGLTVVRTAGPFDERTLPAALGRDHRVAERTWGVLRILDGEVRFHLRTEPPRTTTLAAGDEQPIPPSVLHAVEPIGDGAFRLAVDFLVRRKD